jgi:hypothetical protein
MTGSAPDRKVAKAADGEIPLNLQANYQKEDGKQSIIDPVRSGRTKEKSLPVLHN